MKNELQALKSALDALYTSYPEDSIQRGLIANMLMSHAVLAGEKPLVAEKRKGKR